MDIKINKLTSTNSNTCYLFYKDHINREEQYSKLTMKIKGTPVATETDVAKNSFCMTNCKRPNERCDCILFVFFVAFFKHRLRIVCNEKKIILCT